MEKYLTKFNIAAVLILAAAAVGYVLGDLSLASFIALVRETLGS